MPSTTRTIDTGLTGPVNHAILDSVMGQLSDGKWENTPSMRKYWANASIVDQDGKLFIVVKDGWDSGFRGKDDAWIKAWFAGKIKEIVYDEFDGERWDRKNTAESGYLGRHDQKITVSNAYQAYEILKGRKLGNKYDAPAAPPSPQATPESLVASMLEEGRIAVVTARAYDRNTNRPVVKDWRDENVDLDNNPLFNGDHGPACNTAFEIRDRYQEFWNDLNPRSKEIVLVKRVKMPNGRALDFPVPADDETPMDKFAKRHIRAPKFR